jgi:hypothetical protein
MRELTGGFAWIMDSLESDYAGKIAGRTIGSRRVASRAGNAEFTRREPNADDVLAAFNSICPMEKGHHGFPVECETKGYVFQLLTFIF